MTNKKESLERVKKGIEFDAGYFKKAANDDLDDMVRRAKALAEELEKIRNYKDTDYSVMEKMDRMQNRVKDFVYNIPTNQNAILYTKSACFAIKISDIEAD
jgi:hypothetical protein